MVLRGWRRDELRLIRARRPCSAQLGRARACAVPRCAGVPLGMPQCGAGGGAGPLGDEGHEAQARAAEHASGCGGGSIEAREEILDGERRGLDHGRLAERGTRLIEPRARALAVEAIAADRLESRLGQVREVAGEEGVGGKRHHDRSA